MGLAQVQIQNVALDGGTETDADDFKVLDEAFGNTDDHVVQQGTVRTVQGAKLAAFAGAVNGELIAFNGSGDAFRKRPGKLAFGAFHLNGRAVNLYRYLVRQCDGFFTNSGHMFRKC